jgi:O-antigen ligase
LAERLIDWRTGFAMLGAMLVGGVGLLAGQKPELALLAAFGLALVLLIFADLAMGVAVVAFVSSFSILTLGEDQGFFSVWKLSATLLMLSWLGLLATRSQVKAKELFDEHPTFVYLLLLFVAWLVMSVAWAKDPGYATTAVFQFVGYLILLPIAYSALQERKHFRWFFLAFILGAIASGAYGVAIADYDPEGRLGGGSGGPNAIAMLGVAGFFLSFGMFAAWRRSPALRAVAVATAAASLGMLFLSLSRGGLTGFGVALVLSLIVVSRGRGKLAMAAVVSAVAVVGYFGVLAPEESRNRVTESGSGSGRVDIWTVGWRMVEDRPVVGVGAGNFIPSLPDYIRRPGALDPGELYEPSSGLPKYAHNSYLQIWAETGLVGLLMFLGALGFAVLCTAKAARTFARRGDPEMGGMARALFAAQVGLMGMAFFESIQLTHQLWLLMALGPPMLALARRDAPEAEAQEHDRRPVNGSRQSALSPA